MHRWAWTAIAAALLGCSSSGGGGDECGKVAACGGNLVGTWNVVDACTSGAPTSAANPNCPSEMLHVSSSTVSGTMTYNADMTYSISFTETASDTLTLPVSCLGTYTCETFPMTFNSTTMATCTTAGAYCNCNVPFSVKNTTQGTYSVSGNTLTTTASNGGSSNVGGGGYCVSGSTLHLLSVPMGGTFQDIVATKK